MMDPKRPARKKQKHRRKTIGNLRFASKPRTLFPLYFMIGSNCHTCAVIKPESEVVIVEELEGGNAV